MFSRPKPTEFVVIGLGRFGSSVALGLMHDKHTVLGIDRDVAVVQEFNHQLTHAVSLDATCEDALNEVGITDFDTAVVAIGDPFEANLLTTLQLKRLGVRRVVGRATTELQRIALIQVGADQVVMPENDAGWWFSGILASPGVRDYLEIGDNHSITDVTVPAALVGKTLRDAALQKRFNISVLVVKRATTTEVIVHPPDDFRLVANDSMIVFCTDTDFDRFMRAM